MVTTKPKLKGPPPDMEVPQEIVLKRSGVDPERIGIWCKSHIPCGKKFGPFMGNKVQEATDDMDPTYVWEIVDLSTKEFLFYIDATNEKEGNWMRYINCARYFEEQNIVSEQEGVDIIYRAIKDIYPEQELLTWYEKAPLRKRKGKRIKRAIKDEEPEPSSSSSCSDSKPVAKAAKMCNSQSMCTVTCAGNKMYQEDSSKMDPDVQKKTDGDSSELHVSQRGRRCKVTKYWEMVADLTDEDDDDDSDVEIRSVLQDGRKSESTHKATHEEDKDWTAEIADPEMHHKSMPHLTAGIMDDSSKDLREYYQFEMKPCHVVRSRVGRKLFQCDICSSVYRHSFSLKRHYIRNHLNYKYVSPTDLINCCVPLKSLPTSVRAELGKVVKPDASIDSLSTSTQKDIALDDLASEENDLDKAGHQGHSAIISSPSMESLASISRDDLTEESSRMPSGQLSPHSNDIAIREEDVKDIHHDSSEKMDCYDGDTEIEEESSENESENVTGDMVPCIKKDDELIKAKDKNDESTISESKLEAEPSGGSVDSNLKSSETCTECDLQGREDSPCCDGAKDAVMCKCPADDTDCKRNDSDSPKFQQVIDKDGSSSSSHIADCSVAGSDKENASLSKDAETQDNKKAYCDHDECDAGHSGNKPNLQDQESSLCSGCKSSESSVDHKSLKSLTEADVPVSKPDTGDVTSSSEGTSSSIPVNGKGEPMYGLYRCNVCEKVFNTIPELKEHLANHPDATDGRQTFACEKCEMKFAHKQNLMRHQAVHTGARPYICSYCDKKFPTSTNLRRHEKLHQAHKFSCPHCHSGFTQTGDLKKHVHKNHPELFHECGFCTRYFVKKRLLLDHLRETHDGRTIDDNSVEIEAKQEAFRYDVHLDRAESMRLAITHGKNKPGPRFACTVCRKKFNDYTSMCRHRRLAHQRPIFVPPITDENGDIVDDAVQHYTNPCKHGFYDPEDEEQAVFYASIANVIADNMQNCIEGKEEQLKEVSTLVKWKNKNNNCSLNSKSESEAKSAKVIADSIVYNLQEFNFPKDFKLKSSSNCYRAVPYSSDGRISWKNKKAMSERRRTESTGDQGQSKVTGMIRQEKPASSHSSQGTSSALLQFLQNDITSISHTMTSTSILASAELNSNKESALPPMPPLVKRPKLEIESMDSNNEKFSKSMPIRVPQVKSCKICRCLFHNHNLYQQHMQHKHGIFIEEERKDFHEGQNSISHSENSPKLPLPAHLNSGATSLTNGNNDSKMLNGHSGTIQCQSSVTIKTEPVWDEQPDLSELKNDVDSTAGGAGGSVTVDPSQNDDLQPLDLSKKSHLAGYKLTNKDGANSSETSNDVCDTVIAPSQEEELKKEPKPQETGAKFICGACHGRYDTYDELITHQEADHPNVTCTYTQLDEEVARSLLTTPNPIGILNVCSTQLPPVTASPKRTNKLSCTKCSKTFQCMADLHNHIADCAEPYIPKMMFVYYYPGAKNRHFFLPGAKGEMVKVKKGQKFRHNTTDTSSKKNTTANASTSTPRDATPDGVLSEDSQNDFQKQKDGQSDDLDIDQMMNGKKKRRRNYELLYNPHKHIRRREMAEIIDTPKCFGCNGLFSTISLLERHIPLCRHKDKIQDQASKENEPQGEVEEDEDSENAYDPNKHMCIYCEKQFTYFGMLRKHVFDICTVRADLVEKGEYIDEEWERDISARAGQSGNVQSRTLSRQSSMSSLNGVDSVENGDNSTNSKSGRGNTRNRRRRRGNGWYRGKDKKKDNSANKWERYFVLDETFMGIYNTVARTDDDDDDEDDEKDVEKSSWTGTGDGSMESIGSMNTGKEKVSLDESSTRCDKQRDYLEEMQHKKQALFAELTKPIEVSDSVEKQPITLLGVKLNDTLPEKVGEKKQKEKLAKQLRSEEKSSEISPTKKDANQKTKARISSADSLANVKQKLAKKIRENKKLHRNNSSGHDGQSPLKSMKLDKSPSKYVKKTPKKEISDSQSGKNKSNDVRLAILAKVSSKCSTQKAKMKSPLKLSVSGRKQSENVGMTESDSAGCKTEDITGIQKVKKLKPKIGKFIKNGNSSAMANEEFSTLGEIVDRYTKGRCRSPKMWLGRPRKKTSEEENEEFEDHMTVDQIINDVAKGVSASQQATNNVIEVIDLSDEDEDNIKLSELCTKVEASTKNRAEFSSADAPKQTFVKSKSASAIMGIKEGTRNKSATINLVKKKNDNDYSESLAKSKSPKRICRKVDGGNTKSPTKMCSPVENTEVKEPASGREEPIKAADEPHVRSRSESTISVGDIDGKPKELSRKRPRSFECGTVGKRLNDTAVQNDVKATPKKAKTGKVSKLEADK